MAHLVRTYAYYVVRTNGIINVHGKQFRHGNKPCSEHVGETAIRFDPFSINNVNSVSQYEFLPRDGKTNDLISLMKAAAHKS